MEANAAVILEKVEQLTSRFGIVEGKIDAMIIRNSQADTKLAVIESEITSHNKSDSDKFDEIRKKHNWYDKSIVGALCFGVGELIWIVFELVKK